MGQFEGQLQTQTLSPQIIQALNILQMDMQELKDYLEEQMQSNPVLELDYASPSAQRQAVYREGGFESYHAASYSRDDEEEDDYIENAASETDYFSGIDLVSNIMLQLPSSAHALSSAVRFLAQQLNADGYLETPVSELAGYSVYSSGTLQNAWQLIRAMNPPGLGAVDLKDCLLLQLHATGKKGLEEAIVAGHLDLLAGRQYRDIARALHVTEKEVREACAFIRQLDPRPGSAFARQQSAEYIIPDILILPDEAGQLNVTLNDSFLPKININHEYSDMLRSSGDKVLKEYLNGCFRDAGNIQRAIEHRRDTMRKCALALAERQSEFFLREQGALNPLTMAQLAAQTGVHTSTVSRVVKNKYIQCRRGVFPVSYFFQAALSSSSGEDVSAESIRREIKHLIAGEDKKKPLSDQTIADLLTAKGQNVARRTVAKYREELGIPSTSKRRE